MSIFEDLENLNVSEECFDDIMGIVEALLDRTNKNFEKAKADFNTPELKEIGQKAYKSLTTKEKEKYDKAAQEYHKRLHQDLKAIRMRDDSEWNSRGHNYKGETKGERGQRAADYRNPRYSGEHGMYIKDRRAQQDAESGYNVAINKAIRRHKGEK